MSSFPIQCFSCVPGRAYLFFGGGGHKYKSCVKNFSWSALAGRPEIVFSPRSEPDFGGPNLRACLLFIK